MPRSGILAGTSDKFYSLNKVGPRFATVRFTTIHFYGPCPVGPSTANLWCITFASPPSFLYLVRFQLFSDVHVFLFYFSAVLLS
jgi:hypothetical protein